MNRPESAHRSLLGRPGYVAWAAFGVVAATLIIAAATQLTAAIAIFGVLAVMTIVWSVGYLRDGVSLLTVYVVLLCVVPAPFSISGLKSVGAPSFLFAGGLGIWWVFERFVPTERVRPGARPMHFLVGLFAVSWFVSYAIANLRVHAGVEERAMDRSLMLVIGWVGVTFAAIDGTPSRDRLRVLGRRVAYAGGYVALVAILQSRKIYDLAQLRLPGLSVQGTGTSVYDVRSGFERIKSTTLHPIELAAVLGVMLPLALHYLVTAQTRRQRAGMIVCTALIAIAMPMAVTRTGVLTFGVSLLVLIPAWPKPWRRKFLLISIPGILVLRAALPGLLGTLRSLFTSANDDPSVTGRTQDFPVIFDLIGRNPVFGMGPGTFSPAKYFYLDNQFLGTLVELGGFGALTMVALFVGALVVAGQARRLSGLEEDRLFARALSAGILSGFVTFATFDALSFPVMSGLMFLYVGMVGSLYRLNRQAADDRANRARVASPDSEDVEAAAATT